MDKNFAIQCVDMLQWMEETIIPNVAQIFNNTFITELNEEFNEAEKKINCIDEEFLRKFDPLLTRIKQVNKLYYEGIDTNEFMFKCINFRLSIFEQQEWIQIYRDRVKDTLKQANKDTNLNKCMHIVINTPSGWQKIDLDDDYIPNPYLEPETPPCDPLASLKQGFKNLKQEYNCKFFNRTPICFIVKDIRQYKNAKVIDQLQVGDKLNWDIVRSSSENAKLRVLSPTNKILGKCIKESETINLLSNPRELIESIEQGWINIDEIVVEQVEPRKYNSNNIPIGIPKLCVRCLVTETEGGKSL